MYHIVNDIMSYFRYYSSKRVNATQTCCNIKWDLYTLMYRWITFCSNMRSIGTAVREYIGSRV